MWPDSRRRWRWGLGFALAGRDRAGSDEATDGAVSVQYEKYELPNGLDVVLHVDRSDPIAAVTMTFHVGSSRELEERTGFAHLFEHLFFLDLDVPKAAQSVVMIGKLALSQTDAEFYPATVMNFRLGGGGFASDLTQLLREQKGYTYRVASGFAGTDLPGPFMISSSVRSNVRSNRCS